MSVSMHDQLRAQVALVSDRRRMLATAKATLDTQRHAFEQQHDDLIQSVKVQTEQLEESETALRALTLAQYEATGETKPVAGVQVKQIESLKYDPTEAFGWAKTTGLALKPESLDVKAFEKVAKATALPFVEIVKTPRADIASDLKVEVVV